MSPRNHNRRARAWHWIVCLLGLFWLVPAIRIVAAILGEPG